MERKSNIKQLIGRWGLLGLLLALMTAVLFSDIGEQLSLANLAQNRTTLAAFVATHFWQALILFFTLYVASTSLSVPGGAVLTMAGGFLFGVWLGGAVTIVAATLGALAVFLIAKTSLGAALRERAQGSIEKLRHGFNENAFNYLLFLRLVPLFPFWLVNLAPALLDVPLRIFVVATFIGIIPGTFAFAFFGAGLESILAKHQGIYDACVAAAPQTDCTATPSIGQLLTPEIILSLCLLGVVALVPIYLQKKGATKT